MTNLLEYIEDALFDGDEGRIEAAVNRATSNGSKVAYAFTGSDFTVRVGKAVSRFHGVTEPPNCISAFGAEHVF